MAVSDGPGLQGKSTTQSLLRRFTTGGNVQVRHHAFSQFGGQFDRFLIARHHAGDQAFDQGQHGDVGAGQHRVVARGKQRVLGNAGER